MGNLCPSCGITSHGAFLRCRWLVCVVKVKIIAYLTVLSDPFWPLVLLSNMEWESLLREEPAPHSRNVNIYREQDHGEKSTTSTSCVMDVLKYLVLLNCFHWVFALQYCAYRTTQSSTYAFSLTSFTARGLKRSLHFRTKPETGASFSRWAKSERLEHVCFTGKISM